MKKKNGFTMVELLITIAIIGTILAIAGTMLFSTIKNSKEKSLAITKNNILKSARIYAEEDTDIAWINRENYYVNSPAVEPQKKSFTCVPVNQLINKGLLKNEVKNDISDKEKYVVVWKNEDNTIITETFDEKKFCSSTVIAVDIPTKDICTNPTYNNGNEQELTQINDVANEYNGIIKIKDNEKATNAGTYEVIFSLNTGYWSDGTTGEKTVNCSIKKATPELTLQPNYTVNDNGDENAEVLKEYETILTSDVSGTIVLKVSNPDYYEVTVENDNYSVEAETEKTIIIKALSTRNVEGKVTITLIPDDKNNYYSNSTTYTIHKPKKTFTSVKTPICYDVTYNGNEQNLLPTSDAYSLKGDYKATEPGEYKTTATLNYGYKWEDESTEPKNIYCSIKATYTIRYHSNKGTGTMPNDTVKYMEPFTPAENKFTRKGYQFENWNENSLGMGNQWNSQESKNYTYKTDMNLYAQWAANTYTIKYNGNGNTSGSTADSKHTYDSYKTLTTNGFVKTGYVFNGWNTKADGTGNSYNDKQSVINLTTQNNDIITLYAQWIAEVEETPATYTISYDANGGNDAPGNQTKTHDVTLRLTYDKPNKENISTNGFLVTFNANYGNCSTPSLRATNTTSYTFKNWNTIVNESGTGYSPGGSYKENKDATLYAQWNSSTTNGSISLPAATRSGYTFKGWAESKTATSGVTGSYTPTKDVTLYAIWKKETVQTYTITYNANGGTGAPSSQTKTHDVTLPLSSTKPTKANTTDDGFLVTFNSNGGSVSPSSKTAQNTTSYSFKNWNTMANGSGTTYNPRGNYTANSSATLYAQWSESKTNGSITLPTPTRSNYTFKGWSESKTATSGITGNYTPTKDVTMYAIWEQQQTPTTYTITFDVNGGTAWTKNTCTGNGISYSNYKCTKSITNGSKYGTLAPSPGKQNSTFDGWYTEKTGGTKITADSTFNLNNNQTLYAHWNDNQTQTPTTYNVVIKYSTNGGTITSSTTSSSGTKYSWTTNNNIISLNGTVLEQKIAYGSSTGTDGLNDYNNSKYINITNSGYSVPNGSEWICLSGCTTNNKTFNQASQYSANDFCNASSKDCTVTLGVNWQKNQTHKVTIKFNTNGGTINKNGYTADSDGLIKKDSSIFTQVINYDSSTGQYGLTDYNNSNGVYITRTGYSAVSGAEWKCLSNNCKNTTYTHSDKDINANEFCDASTKDCEITLGVNWTPKIYTMTLDDNGGSGGSGTIYLKYNDAYYSNSSATTKITNVKVPTKNGERFLGYYYTTQESKQTYQVIDASGKIGNHITYTANHKFVAHWEIIENVALKLNISGVNTKLEKTYTATSSSNTITKKIACGSATCSEVTSCTASSCNNSNGSAALGWNGRKPTISWNASNATSIKVYSTSIPSDNTKYDKFNDSYVEEKSFNNVSNGNYNIDKDGYRKIKIVASNEISSVTVEVYIRLDYEAPTITLPDKNSNVLSSTAWGMDRQIYINHRDYGSKLEKSVNAYSTSTINKNDLSCIDGTNDAKNFCLITNSEKTYSSGTTTDDDLTACTASTNCEKNYYILWACSSDKVGNKTCAKRDNPGAKQVNYTYLVKSEG